MAVAAESSTEKVEERLPSGRVLPLAVLLLLLLAELTLELELELGAGVESGRYGAGWSMAAFGGLGGDEEDAAMGAAIGGR